MRHSTGFVLASVLWLLAGLTVVAALVGRYTLTTGENSQLLRYRAEAELAFLSSRSQVLQLLVTTRTQPEGRVGAATPLRVDGTIYVGSGETTVALQDSRGLIDLNRSDEPTLMRLLEVCGVAESERGRLTNALLDYIDSDNLTRINGAEADVYKEKGLPPPRNAPLLEVAEVWQVLGWASLQAEWDKNGCTDAITVSRDGGFNINTAPEKAMLTQGVPLALVSSILQQRFAGERPSTTGIAAATDSFQNPLARSTNSYPGSIYRVTHKHHPSGLTLNYWVTLNTSRPDMPWLIQSEAVSISAPEPPDKDRPHLPVFVNSSTNVNESARPNNFPFF